MRKRWLGGKAAGGAGDPSSRQAVAGFTTVTALPPALSLPAPWCLPSLCCQELGCDPRSGEEFKFCCRGVTGPSRRRYSPPNRPRGRNSARVRRSQMPTCSLYDKHLIIITVLRMQSRSMFCVSRLQVVSTTTSRVARLRQVVSRVTTTFDRVQLCLCNAHMVGGRRAGDVGQNHARHVLGEVRLGCAAICALRRCGISTAVQRSVS